MIEISKRYKTKNSEKCPSFMSHSNASSFSSFPSLWHPVINKLTPFLVWAFSTKRQISTLALASRRLSIYWYSGQHWFICMPCFILLRTSKPQTLTLPFTLGLTCYPPEPKSMIFIKTYSILLNLIPNFFEPSS